MILGCGCHCVEESSESVPSESVSSESHPSDSNPSESASSDGIPPIETSVRPCGTHVKCSGNIVPLKYRLTVANPGTGSGVCRLHYYGSFTLFFETNACYRYNSAERPKQHNGVGCPDLASGFRWTLNVNAFVAGTTIMAVQGKLHFNSTVVAIVTFSLTQATPNCVSEFTLPKTSVDDIGYHFPTTCKITAI